MLLQAEGALLQIVLGRSYETNNRQKIHSSNNYITADYRITTTKDITGHQAHMPTMALVRGFLSAIYQIQRYEWDFNNSLIYSIIQLFIIQIGQEGFGIMDLRNFILYILIIYII